MYAVASYERPATLDAALELLRARPEARLLAGGTDLLVKLREEPEPLHLVDISRLPELLDEGLEPDGTVRLGAGMTFSRIAASPLVGAHAPLLAEAALSVAGPQIRHMGTLGGNLCNGAVSADLAAPLLVLDAGLRLRGTDGTRRIPLAGFHLRPGKVSLAPGEILEAVTIAPEAYRHAGTAWYKYATRAAMDIATVGCAAWLRPEEGRIGTLKLAFTVAAPVPVRCPHAEAAAAGRALDQATLDAIADAVAEDVKPRTSWRADKEFRLHIIRVLARRMTLTAARRAGLDTESLSPEEA